jgi:ABC-type transport system involved in cytochrome bd biosynthesis fused ATPase/permease subunit
MTPKPPTEAEIRRAAQARLVAIVLVATVILWMGAQWLGGQLGWETRFVFLFDFVALAAFLWAMVVTYQIWRGRQS